MESAKTEAADNHTAGGHPLPPDWLARMVSSHFGGDGFAASLLATVMGTGMLVGALALMALNPQRKLARVMGLFTALNGLTIPAGTAVGGIIAEVTGTPLFFTLDGVFILALALAIALPKSVRALK